MGYIETGSGNIQKVLRLVKKINIKRPDINQLIATGSNFIVLLFCQLLNKFKQMISYILF